MITKIKMCGLRRTEDIAFANEVMPDFVGFVFAPKSKRYVTPETAVKLAEKLDRRIVTVGVFVNADFDTIRSIYDSGAIRMAQLHGNEPDELAEKLQACGIPVIRAFKIKSAEDIANAEKSPADFILLDSGEGSGKLFDHSLIGSINRPYFLAGGLDSTNARSAVEKFHPYAVDASSSLETDGFKDLNKMRDFAHAVRKDN